MDDGIHAALKEWTDFYLIVGAAAGAMAGLMFVTITLVADSRSHGTSKEVEAFATPTIVHFIAPLVLSAIATAPWRQLAHVALALELVGASGMAYGVYVARLARRQSGYRPEPSDWAWFLIFPFLAYALLTASGLLLRAFTERALFGVGAVAVLLLLIAIRNTWDSVTYLAVVRREKERGDGRGDAPGR